jgi:hypothetical protein
MIELEVTKIHDSMKNTLNYLKIKIKKYNRKNNMNFLYDIIEQFEINEVSGLIKFDPFYIFENLIVTILFLLVSY